MKSSMKNQKYEQLRTNMIFFLFEETPPPESALWGSRWASKTPAVPSFYKRCTPWLELETCYVDLEPKHDIIYE
jgi:hypothetical protein